MPQLVGAALGSLALSLTAGMSLAASATAFSIATAAGVAIGNVGIGVGLSILAGSLSPRPKGIKPSDGQVPRSDPVSPRMKSFGTVRIAGSRFWNEADGLNGVLSDGRALNHGRIGGFISYHVDDNVVTIDGDGVITSAPYDALATAEILTRLGEESETAYEEIETDFGYAEVRGDGVASLLGRFDNFDNSEDQYQNFPNGPPRLKVTIDSSVVFDPRDPAQFWYDPASWLYSDNPVLAALTNRIDRDGFGNDYERQIAPNIAEWIAAANACDVMVVSPAAGGSEKRYRVAGTFALTDRPADIEARLLETFDGRCWQRRDGSIGISVGEYTAPAVTIGNADIIAYEMTNGQDNLRAVGGIRAQYMSPAHDYREQDAEPWPDGETVMALEDERVANLDLTWVPSHGQARRLMKRAMIRATAPWRGTITTNLAGLRALDERFINVEIDELGISRSFEVGKFHIDLSRMECQMEILAVGPEIDEWSPDEEGIAPSIPAGLVWIDGEEGERFSNFNSNEGKAFDGGTDKSYTQCAVRGAANGYIGKFFDVAKAFGKAIVYGANNGGFIVVPPGSFEPGTVTLIIRGKNGSAPANRTDGDNLGEVTFANTPDESGGREIISTDTNTAYDYLWLDIEGEASLYVAELAWWEYT